MPEFGPEMLDAMPMVSLLRERFFALQLFKEQMFSMDKELSLNLAAALSVRRKECCENKGKYNYSGKCAAIEFPDWELWLRNLHYKCATNHMDSKFNRKEYEAAMRERKSRLSEHQQSALEEADKMDIVWWHKIQHFCQTPNERQCVKFDRISDVLKRYFLDQSEERDVRTGEKKWVISFEEITTVYPDVEEIHFMNQYRFDDVVLRRLIDQIQRKDRENTLRKVVFLYFEYKECDAATGMPLDAATIFKDPGDLDKESRADLEALGWNIKHCRIGRAGYKIILSAIPNFVFARSRKLTRRLTPTLNSRGK